MKSVYVKLKSNLVVGLIKQKMICFYTISNTNPNNMESYLVFYVLVSLNFLRDKMLAKIPRN